MRDFSSFLYGPADAAALEERENKRLAYEFALSLLNREPAAMNDAHNHVEDYSQVPERRRLPIARLDELEQALREAAPGEAVQVVPELIDQLAQRRATHGDFSDDARTSQSLKYIIREGRNWNELTQVQQEALDNIATKIGRILSGNPNHADHWSDIQGYAHLVQARLAQL
jgi:hypothetical protein